MKKSVCILVIVVASLVSACNTSHEVPQSEGILNSTVQINMWIFPDGNGGSRNNLTVEQAQVYLTSSASLTLMQGLGTVVQVQGSNYILTHGHWGQLTDVGLVQILDAGGNVLCSMTRSEFKQLMLFQDVGTTVLRAPENLGIAPAAMGSFAQVKAGQIVRIARRQPGEMNKVEVVEARVEAATDFKSQEAWELKALNGDFIARGDSGGGIWLDGQWIGNTWAIVLLKQDDATQVADGTAYAAQCPAQVFDVVSENALALPEATAEEPLSHGEKNLEGE